MPAILLLALLPFFGFACLRIFPLRLTRIERLLAAHVVGILIGSQVTLLAVLAFGYSFGLVAALTLVGCATYLLFQRQPRLSEPEASAPVGMVARAVCFAAVGTAIAWIGYHYFQHMLSPGPGGLYSTGDTWSDLALHTTLVNFMAKRETFSFALPIYYSGRLTYPFLFDFYASLFLRAGFDLHWSFFLSGFPVLLALVSLIRALSLRLFRSLPAATLAVILYLFNGSAYGLYFFWKDFQASDKGLGAFLREMPQNYSHLPKEDLHFTNTITTHFFSQRSILLGFCVFLIVVLILREAWHTRERATERQLLGAAAVLVGLLPFAHVHTFLAALLVIAWLAGVHTVRQRSIKHAWAMCLLIGGLLATPPFAYQMLSSYHEGFGHWLFGWMKPSDGSFWIFWLKNLGFALPLLFANLYVAWRYRADRFLLHLVIPLSLLFVIANAYVFQPNIWDNMKFFVYAYFGLTLVTSWYLGEGLRSGHWARRMVAGFAVLGLTLAGCLGATFNNRVIGTLVTDNDLAFIKAFESVVPVDALVLTGDTHNHPVPTLSGRRVVMGFPAWLWSYGIEPKDMYPDIQAMYRGGAEAVRLFQKYHVSYVVIGTNERTRWRANTAFFDASYPKVYQDQTWKIYRIYDN